MTNPRDTDVTQTAMSTERANQQQESERLTEARSDLRDSSVRTAHAHIADDMRRPDADRDVTQARYIHLDDTHDFKVAEGDPDIRGWDVRASDGQNIGKVTDLVIDTLTMKVRYLEAKLQQVADTSAKDRTVLIAINTARLDDHENDVLLVQTASEARQLPSYTRGTDSLNAFGADGGTDMNEGGFFGGRRTGRESSSYIAPTSSRPNDLTNDV